MPMLEMAMSHWEGPGNTIPEFEHGHRCAMFLSEVGQGFKSVKLATQYTRAPKASYIPETQPPSIQI